jgi:predicted transcriptional regulator
MRATVARAKEEKERIEMRDRLIPIDEDARLVQEREARLTSLDASIARGVADADAGRVKSIGAVFDNLESKLKAKATPR